MKSVVGIFESSDEARRAAQLLRGMLKSGEKVELLTPENSQTGLESTVPTQDAETQGIGRAIGGVIGGAIALAGAAHFGSFIWSKYPSNNLVGLLVAIGIVLFGALGIWAGVKIMGLFEEASTEGIPHDELYLYQDALQKNHSVVVALTDSEERAEQVRNTMSQFGAEALDEARDRWWIGLKSAESEHFTDPGIHSDDPIFKKGYEASQHPDFKDHSYDEYKERLVEHYGDDARRIEFRKGFEHGRAFNRWRSAA
jgi:hypothetical protein